MLLQDGIRATVHQRGVKTADELLRSVFGHERAEAIGAALMPEVVKASGRGKRPGRAEAKEERDRIQAEQGGFFQGTAFKTAARWRAAGFEAQP